MGIFSGLEGLGLKNLDSDSLFEEDKKTETEEKQVKITVKSQRELEAELLYDKSFTCPVCDKNFTNKRIRGNVAKLKAADFDMRPVYQGIEPIKYDVVMCPHCGYAALTRFHGPLSPAIAKMVKEAISNKYIQTEESKGSYSYEEAIMRYKMALANSAVRKGKASEKGYICLRTAWLIRSYYESDEVEEDAIELLKEDEMEFLQNAYQGLSKARMTESSPICGMDSQTLDYLLVTLAIECDEIDDAGKLISKLLSERNLNPRISKKLPEVKEAYNKKKLEKE